MIYDTASAAAQVVRSNASFRWKVGGAATLATLLGIGVVYKRKQNRAKSFVKSLSKTKLSGMDAKYIPKKSKKARIDMVFVKRLFYILKIALPKKWKSREFVKLCLLTGVLMARTWMTLLISKNMGQSVALLCEKNFRKLGTIIVQFAVMTIPASLLNSYLKYLTGQLSIDLREKLTQATHKMYFENMNYYKANKVGDSKLVNADQLIAEDIQKFSVTTADVYTQILKPCVDFVLFSAKLVTMLGLQGPLGMYGWFATAAFISSLVLPSYGRLAAEEQRLEGCFRAKEAAIIQNSEMVAFMGGERPELNQLERGFRAIYYHIEYSLRRKLVSNVVMGYINKYFASVVGFWLVIAPVYYNTQGMNANTSPAQIAEYYVVARQIMEGLADAVLRLFDVQKRVGALSGLTARVHTMLSVLEHPEDLNLPKDPSNPPVFVDSDVLKFERVNVYRPDGVLLIKELNLTVEPGARIIITGENGAGKSSLFRVLRGLWPLAAGTVHKPSNKDFYFLSQVNFVPVGSMRDIIIYPETVEDMAAKGKTDKDLQRCIMWAHLTDLSVKDIRPTLDTELDWEVDLSPGQKQRMAFARLLYHCPRYAVLDECTNGVAPDVELDLYNRCSKLGIAVFSISHKIELKKVHDFELNILHDGLGGWDLIDHRRGE
jgi:ABC-type uncharacterized transport system fused permease/ATPase subunit